MTKKAVDAITNEKPPETKRNILRSLWSWLGKVWNASKNPNNVANSLILAIFLYSSLWIYGQLNTHVDFEVYSNFDLEGNMIIEGKNETTVYFTLANTGDVPLELWEVYVYSQDVADLSNGVYNNWTLHDKDYLLDESNQPLTKTVLVPMEKLKLHYTFKKPINTIFSGQAINMCPFWKIKGFALNYEIWKKLSPQTVPTGECFSSYVILWR